MPLDDLTRLLTTAKPELPEWVSVAVSDPSSAQEDSLFPVERSAIARAIVTRRNEFTAGRAAARDALAQLGQPRAQIPMGEDRAPVWPTGFVGSISHTDQACVATAAHAAHAKALGIDLENFGPLSDEVRDSFCTKSELAQFGQPPSYAARLIFSAKEAVYKAQYAVSKTLFGYDTLRVTAASDTEITLKFAKPVAPFQRNETMTIRQWHNEAMILSFALIQPKTPSPLFA